MNSDAMATRMSVLTRALPLRVLIVDDDELELSLMADRLAAAGFEVTRAANGEEALAQVARQWFPLVITDWQMPVMDGIALTEALRERGVSDTYIIMLTMRETSLDYERGYVAGVDDYLTKKVPDAELFARIHGAFNTLALRRSLRETRSALEESVAIDADSGAFAARELYSKLHSELRRAQRYGRMLTIMTVGVQAAEDGSQALPAATLHAVFTTLQGLIRAHVDWVGRIEATAGATFVVVLPEASISEAPLIKERVVNGLKRHEAGSEGHAKLRFSFGAAALERESGSGVPVEEKEMIVTAEHCRVCAGCAGPAQLAAVQHSVAAHTAIVCRRGYAVDSQCSLKSQPTAGDSLAAAG